MFNSQHASRLHRSRERITERSRCQSVDDCRPPFPISSIRSTTRLYLLERWPRRVFRPVRRKSPFPLPRIQLKSIQGKTTNTGITFSHPAYSASLRCRGFARCVGDRRRILKSSHPFIARHNPRTCDFRGTPPNESQFHPPKSPLPRRME